MTTFLWVVIAITAAVILSCILFLVPYIWACNSPADRIEKRVGIVMTMWLAECIFFSMVRDVL